MICLPLINESSFNFVICLPATKWISNRFGEIFSRSTVNNSSPSRCAYSKSSFGSAIISIFNLRLSSTAFDLAAPFTVLPIKNLSPKNPLPS